MRKAIKHTVLTLAIGFGLAGSASAAIETISGTHTLFSFDDALLGLFGAPSVSGDTLFFTPNSFSAKATGTSALDFNNATINVKVLAKPGYSIAGVNVTEQGDYWLFRLGSGNLGTSVSGQIRVRNLSDLAETTDGLNTTVPMTTVGLGSINWTATASAALPSWQASAVNLTIENLLLAYTDTTKPSLAFVEKKYIGASALVTAVPEPESYAMLLAGLGMIGVVARRRMK